MSEINFPSDFKPYYRYIVAGNFTPSSIKITDSQYFYQYDKVPSVITPKIDTSNVTIMSSMFAQCSKIYTVPYFDTSKVTKMNSMFQSCSELISVPLFDTSNVQDMSYMFNYCYKLTSVPHFDTSKVTNMSNMFSDCRILTEVPEFDMSNVTSCNSMFYSCGKLVELPNLNCKKVTSLGMFSGCTSLQKIGVIDCDSITNASNIVGGNSCKNITHLGGFRNLGMKSSVSNTNGNYFLYNQSKLTHESLLNIFNLLYDRAAAGYSVLTIKLHENHLAMLSDEDIAIATNKGWTIA